MYFTLRGICSNVETDPVKKKCLTEQSNNSEKVKERLNKFFTPLAEAYIEICEMQEQQFYGLRDFYRFAHKRTGVHL